MKGPPHVSTTMSVSALAAFMANGTMKPRTLLVIEGHKRADSKAPSGSFRKALRDRVIPPEGSLDCIQARTGKAQVDGGEGALAGRQDRRRIQRLQALQTGGNAVQGNPHADPSAVTA